MNKQNLKKLTITIPVRFDSRDRFNNLIYTTNYLKHYFDCTISVYEQKLVDSQYNISNFDTIDDYCCEIIESPMEPFHRTKYLNILARRAKTPYIANYDCDVFFKSLQFIKAVNLLDTDELDGVYPYDGYFVNLSKKFVFEQIGRNFNEYQSFDNNFLSRFQSLGKTSVGGCIIWNKKKFIEGGMENENFVSWGWEDVERKDRFIKLGYRIGRINGPLYHIDHARSQDSCDLNIHVKDNEEEYKKIFHLTKEELRKPMEDWNWLKY